MNILIAPNAFKNSLNAQNVAVAIAQGLQQSNLRCNCRIFPVGDGGDGTGNLLIKHLNGIVINKQVAGPLGHQITAGFGLLNNGKTAVIELAAASGISLLTTAQLNPMQANTFGTGQLIKAALDDGVDEIIICMGGSATIDAGAGILSALGVVFLDKQGNILEPVPQQLTRVAVIDTSGIDKRIFNCRITILCDVDNTLLGHKGAAAMFGPQKGASVKDIVKLDAMLTQFTGLALQQTGNNMAAIKHSGTAGGAAAGMYAFLNAKLVSGADYFLTLTGFDAALQNIDLVITGEGSIDEQTLQGKAPYAVATRAKKYNIKVIGLAGQVPTDGPLYQCFDELCTINNPPASLKAALKNTHNNLVKTAKEIGKRLALNQKA